MALAQAVERYSVHHPVLDDPDLVTWAAYTARAWPTLVLIDPRATSSRSTPGRATPTRSPRSWASWSRRTASAARCSPATRRTSRSRWSRPTCASRRRRCRWATAGCSSPTPVTTRSWSWTPTGRCSGASRGSASPTGCACCRRTSPPRSATTSSSPTPSSTGCGASRWPTARCARSPATAPSGCRATAPTGSPARGTSPGGRTGSGSRWPASTSCGPSTRAPAPSRSWSAPATRGCSTGRWREAWFAQTSGLAADGDRLWLADSETSALRWVEAAPTVTAGRCARRSAAGCSTSASATAPPSRRCSSTRSA